jgi:Cu+-exporting ATPase
LQSKKATLTVVDDRGTELEERQIDGDLIQRGDLLKVLPGASVPTDGKVIRGTSTIDESIITGEAWPVTKQIGDGVIGGTTNINGLLVIKATRVGQETGI